MAKLLWKAGRKKKRAATGFAWVKFATPRATCWDAARRGLWRSTRNISSAFAPNGKKFRVFQICQRRRNMQAKKPNGSGNGHGGKAKGSNEWRVKVGLAEMLKGGVIIDVTYAEQSRIAAKAGPFARQGLSRGQFPIRPTSRSARTA